MDTKFGFSLFILLLWTCHYCSGQESPNLYCKSCASSQSLRHCELSQKDILCPKGKEKCLEVEFYGDNGQGFVRDCIEEDKCFESKLPQCLAVTGNSSYCSFSCCLGNLCNAGATFRVSSISLASCVIVGLVLYFL
ncbi:uncharacterized protein LOC116299388 [Actinia tenebrosa]|uniref:Uncharacterized protein LOC116299388 n=1 Tax=Actinia tenebrosa TaxID=6105 RepID=A0A6P8ID40_ACTTE|nr:uncharacterized protein LOC116299388 [Actinia tenebrosa]